MKHKVLTIIFIVILLTLFSGITYSIFHSSGNLNSNNRNVAKFIFNAESLERLEFPLIDLNPGDNEEYSFSVTNKNLDSISEVTVEYTIMVKTYHLVPFNIELYKVIENEENLVLTCDESYTRNEKNELICNSPTQEMVHDTEQIDNYKLQVNFPAESNDEVYADLVDYINLEIKSWQKMEE